MAAGDAACAPPFALVLALVAVVAVVLLLVGDCAQAVGVWLNLSWLAVREEGGWGEGEAGVSRKIGEGTGWGEGGPLELEAVSRRVGR